MCSIIGVGKVCIRFWVRLDQNSGFHGNRKPPLTYNGENDVSTFSRLILIQSFLYMQLTFDLGILDSGEQLLPFGKLGYLFKMAQSALSRSVLSRSTVPGQAS